MSSTLRWIVRGLGVLMLIVFAYLLCSMQQRLLDLQEQKRPVSREAPRGQAGRTTPPAALER